MPLRRLDCEPFGLALFGKRAYMYLPTPTPVGARSSSYLSAFTPARVEVQSYRTHSTLELRPARLRGGRRVSDFAHGSVFGDLAATH